MEYHRFTGRDLTRSAMRRRSISYAVGALASCHRDNRPSDPLKAQPLSSLTEARQLCLGLFTLCSLKRKKLSLLRGDVTINHVHTPPMWTRRCLTPSPLVPKSEGH